MTIVREADLRKKTQIFVCEMCVCVSRPTNIVTFLRIGVFGVFGVCFVCLVCVVCGVLVGVGLGFALLWFGLVWFGLVVVVVARWLVCWPSRTLRNS